MNTKWTKKIVCTLVLGCMLLAFGSLALAHDHQGCPPPKCECDGAMPPERPDPADMERHITSSLNKLVTEGTITQEQADKLLNLFKQKDSQRKADMEKMKAMSPEDRDAYLHQQQPHHHPDFINEFKNAAGLSDEQAKSVDEVLRPPHGSKPPC